jgi:hypothetical protein
MSNMQRPLTDDEKGELANLTAAVSAAIAARRVWLDAKMHECSRLQVGDDIYDLTSGTMVGTVSRLYRFWADRDEGVRDTSVHCDYEYETSPRCFDNTSRQSGRSFGSRDDALHCADSAQLERMQRQLVGAEKTMNRALELIYAYDPHRLRRLMTYPLDLDAVAEALHQFCMDCDSDPEWSDAPETLRNYYRRMAKAAIDASVSGRERIATWDADREVWVCEIQEQQ